MSNRQVLGKGLEALIPSSHSRESKGEVETVKMIKIDQIRSSRYQPRQKFDPEKIDQLAESIKRDGLLQPVVLMNRGLYYELIAGERRWRAAKQAGLKEIPALLRVAKESKALELAIVENIQREDLNPIELGEGYRRLMNEFDLTQEELARRLGKSRSVIANTLRLLNLPASIKEDIVEGRLTAGHARVILRFDSEEKQKRFRDKILDENISVRKVEQEGKESLITDRSEQAEIKRIRGLIEQKIGLRVVINHHENKGAVKLLFNDLEDFEKILSVLGCR